MAQLIRSRSATVWKSPAVEPRLAISPAWRQGCLEVLPPKASIVAPLPTHCRWIVLSLKPAGQMRQSRKLHREAPSSRPFAARVRSLLAWQHPTQHERHLTGSLQIRKAVRCRIPGLSLCNGCWCKNLEAAHGFFGCFEYFEKAVDPHQFQDHCRGRRNCCQFEVPVTLHGLFETVEQHFHSCAVHMFYLRTVQNNARTINLQKWLQLVKEALGFDMVQLFWQLHHNYGPPGIHENHS